MSTQLLSVDQLHSFHLASQRAAEYLTDENIRNEYVKRKRRFIKEALWWARASSTLDKATQTYELLAKYFADLVNPTEYEKKCAERLKKSYAALQASLRDEMDLSPQQRANLKDQYQKANVYSHGANSEAKKTTFKDYLSYGITTNPSDIKTVVSINPNIDFQHYRQKNTILVTKALSSFPPRAKVYVVGLDHYGSWSPIRWLPHSLFGSDKPNGRSTIGSGWKDKEAYALAVDLTLKGFYVQNLDKLPKSKQNFIKKLQKDYEKKMEKEESKKLEVGEEPLVSLGKRP